MFNDLKTALERNEITIEDIKNVSGIGDNIFDKIKENITV